MTEEQAEKDCLFCRIVRKEVPADFVYEDEAVAVFADIKPSAPVHHLVVSKVHVASVKDFPEGDGALVGRMILAAKKVAAEAGLRGYRLVWNVGREGGQVIDHIHCHLLGGWERKEDVEALNRRLSQAS